MSKIIRPRRARPAEMVVVARCHASRVRRSAGVRRIVRAVLRPRAIAIPHRKERRERQKPPSNITEKAVDSLGGAPSVIGAWRTVGQEGIACQFRDSLIFGL